MQYVVGKCSRAYTQLLVNNKLTDWRYGKLRAINKCMTVHVRKWNSFQKLECCYRYLAFMHNREIENFFVVKQQHTYSWHAHTIFRNKLNTNSSREKRSIKSVILHGRLATETLLEKKWREAHTYIHTLFHWLLYCKQEHFRRRQDTRCSSQSIFLNYTWQVISHSSSHSNAHKKQRISTLSM